jgi:hypothetical protein
VQNLVSDFSHCVDYLFALRATLDFDHELVRLCNPTSGLHSTIGCTSRDLRQVYSVCALATVPLGSYEERRVPVRMPLDRVGRPGILSLAGAVSMGSSCVAHGYFSEVPATTSIVFANPTSDHVIVRVGTRVGSIAPTHLDADVPLTIGAVCMQNNTSWVDFDKVETDMSPVLDTVVTVRLAPPDESTTPPTWKIRTGSVIELSRRNSPKWHMRLAFDHVNCLPKTMFWYCFVRCIFCIRDGFLRDL